MSRDPYDILGVKRDATQKDIQRAFRKLAKKHHPDLNPGDRPSEERFKEISTAYELLSDEQKRARFDRGEIDMEGAEQAPRHYYREYASASRPGGSAGARSTGFGIGTAASTPGSLPRGFRPAAEVSHRPSINLRCRPPPPSPRTAPRSTR